jgi:pimeloyl-ACP methyl ester carboxylesterase
MTRHEVTQRAPVDGVELEFEVRGTGEPVVFMHAGVCADFFAPLLEQPALVDRYSVVSYHRAGYAGSGRLTGALSLERQATHCRALMHHLGIERAHVVGHSSSASMALQLALDAPDAVQSLALLDPARPAPQSPAQQDMVKAIVEPALGRFGTGDKAGAIDTWMCGVCGPHYRALLERAVPGAFEQAVADADTFFGQELPAVQQWSFGPGQAGRITQLVVTGERSIPVYHERRDLLLAWLPHAESFELPRATHLLHVHDPRGVAEALAAFFARHPAPAPSRETSSARVGGPR